MARFINHLRENDFQVSTKEAIDCLNVLKLMGLSTISQVSNAIRPILVSCRDEWDRFDPLFEAYWFQKGRIRQRPKESDTEAVNKSHQPAIWSKHFSNSFAKSENIQSSDLSSNNESVPKLSENLRASSNTNLHKTDLRYLISPEELNEAEKIAHRLAQALHYRLTRRYQNKKSSDSINIRKTIRNSLSKGGSPINLVFRSRREQPVRLVVMLDVSGSMKSYSRTFMQFVKGLVSSSIEADVFLFHTRLVHITSALQDHDPMKSMTRISLMSEGYGGGTKLAHSLSTFNQFYAKKVITSRSVVIILSDGYDTDEPEQLQNELKQLKKRARRLIWLNPMLGWKDYEPITRSMSAALPYIDYFVAANTLNSLASIESELNQL